ncbi:MAG TPA: hypothetical protein ENJ84_04575 [Gammaproteobacteria bacterium]|nr:hypothetical protein [Gammaproteobacteria bacterium]
MTSNVHAPQKEKVSASASVSGVAAPEVPPKADSVDQIRDILFGAQMGEYEQRFKRLEERLVKENQMLREKLEQRIEWVLGKVQDERGQRETEISQVTGKITETEGQLNQALTVAQKTISGEILHVRDELHEQGKHFEQSLDHRGSSLAGLLRELADKLENQPT